MSRSQPIEMHPDQQLLLEHAESQVRSTIPLQKRFTTCAFALTVDGSLVEVNPSEELRDSKQPLTPLLASLLVRAQGGEIRASVICTPMTMSGVEVAFFDLERRGGRRILVYWSYVKWLTGDWLFGEKQFSEDTPYVFGEM